MSPINALSCRALPIFGFLPPPYLRLKGALDAHACPVPMRNLPDMLMREAQLPGHSRHNPAQFCRASEFGADRCRIHGVYQLSERPHYSKMSSNVNIKTQLKVEEGARIAAGRAFKVARIETGMSQTELAKVFGSTQQTINRWEHGVAGPTVAAIRALGKLISGASRSELFKAAGIEDETEGLLQVNGDTRRIPIFTNPEQIGALNPSVDSYISLPSQWLPQDANIKAAKFANRISPLFGDELIALVDIRYRDPDRLLNCIVVARTPNGNDAMRLSNDGGTYLLIPIGEGADNKPRVLRSEGDWSILGKVVKWIGDAPTPGK